MDTSRKFSFTERLNQFRDGIRLFRMTKMLKKPTEDILKICFPQDTKKNIIDDLSNLIEFNHGALLVVTPIGFVKDWLNRNSFKESVIFPSVIVSSRLGERYLGERKEIRTTIVKAEESSGRKLEIFIPQTTDIKVLGQIVGKDIKHELERHFAFMPKKIIDEDDLTKLARTIIENGFKSEGGGKNEKEGATTLYFTRKGKGEKPVRIELICHGQFQQALETHKKMVT